MTTPAPGSLHHHSRLMGGRDLEETHRVATPLELLFDLTFATSFALAASEFAHSLAAGHYAAALLGFSLASFAICWAWVNFSWFSSAYDTDDWIFRIATMVQMVGVLILALGLPRMFGSIERGDRLDNSVMVLGYVVMRAALVFQWLRAAGQNPDRRRACLTYAVTISIAQAGWVTLIVFDFRTGVLLIISGVLLLIEFAGPAIAERADGGTPWNAHHIVERHGLFAIIALGEGVVGTMAALSAVVEQQGWSMDAALVGVAGTGLTFAMWWIYYLVPSAQILHLHRERASVWAYGQMLIVTSIVATGAGLHAAAFLIEHNARISPIVAVSSVAVPVGVFLGLIYAVNYYLTRRFDLLVVWLLVATAAVVAAATIAARGGVGMAACLVFLMFAPIVTVIGYEVLGYRYQEETLADLER